MKLVFTCFIMLASMLAFGQRTIDMDVVLTNPKDNDVVSAFIAVPVSIKLTNNGPDTLKANDTIWYNTSNIPLFTYHPHILSSDIAPGQNATMQLSELKNLNSGENDQTIDFCVKVVHKDQVPGMSGGDFVDTVLSNNTACSKIIIKSTNVEEIGNDRKVKLYPNPVVDYVRVDLPVMYQPVDYAVYNAMGRMVEKGSVLLNNNASSIQIDTRGYNAGLYFFKLTTSNISFKVISFTKL